ncbi:MAG: hypothetical protein LH478_04825 [Chitinophagaceae bacterium]|nr:hypothetical protein [Chitinophagaceae bacterium]
MKHTTFLFVVVALGLLGSCKQKSEYVDLNTGKTITVKTDPETGYIINTETEKPVYLYVDKSNGDTLYGRTGKVVNKKLVRTGESHFKYDDDGSYTYTNGSYVKKVDNDGDVKITDGDYKKKVDDDGSYKIKEGDYKKKVDEDGNIKIKDGDKKIKIKKD